MVESMNVLNKPETKEIIVENGLNKIKEKDYPKIVRGKVKKIINNCRKVFNDDYDQNILKIDKAIINEPMEMVFEKLSELYTEFLIDIRNISIRKNNEIETEQKKIEAEAKKKIGEIIEIIENFEPRREGHDSTM